MACDGMHHQTQGWSSCLHVRNSGAATRKQLGEAERQASPLLLLVGKAGCGGWAGGLAMKAAEHSAGSIHSRIHDPFLVVQIEH